MQVVSDKNSRTAIVIVGSGMAGGNAAVTLREEGFRDPVVIVSAEPGIPFGRPPLSKTYLRSKKTSMAGMSGLQAGMPTTTSSASSVLSTGSTRLSAQSALARARNSATTRS